MLVAAGCFNHTNVIHITIAVEIQIDKRGVRVIQTLLKILKVFRLTEQLRHDLEVKVSGNVTVGC